MLVDANLLIYAYVPHAPQHMVAKSWLEQQLSTARVALPWATLNAYVRVVTHPRLFAPPVPVVHAMKTVNQLLARSNVWTPGPVPAHAEIMSRLLKHAAVGGNLVYDAHVAAIAVGHGLTVFTNDSDFGRFREVHWVNPLNSEAR